MSGSLRVLAPEELILIAGGSLGDEWYDPNYAIYGGGYITAPVFSATSWTTSSFGNNYSIYSSPGYLNTPGSTYYNPNAPTYANANAFLMANPYHYTPPSNTQVSVTVIPYENNDITSSGNALYEGVSLGTNPYTGGDEILVKAKVLEDPNWLAANYLISQFGVQGSDFLLGYINDALANYKISAEDLDKMDHEVKVLATNLTSEQQTAVAELKEAVARIDAFINSIPENTTVHFSNGDVVSASELKYSWSRADFVVDPAGTHYANGSNRGESNFNGGDPVIRFAVDNLRDYVFNAPEGYNAGANYLVLHELAHLNTIQMISAQANYADGVYSEAERLAFERQANDIARAFASYGSGLEFLATPNDGYGTTTAIPLTS